MAHKQQYQYAVTSALPEKYTGHFPASTHYHFKIKGRGLDISNYAYMQKLLEDSLVAHGVLPDDTPKYVGELRITAEKAPKGAQDEVVVTIVPVGRKTA
jgi:protocatechuate 3,4-dioxygenase beta subunit